ncbi:MAG: winged helix-turn-helix transcriptional regulator [Kiloniellales bacterium]
MSEILAESNRAPRRGGRQNAANPHGPYQPVADCAVARTLDVFADPWTFLVMREAYFGVRRFDAFRAALEASRGTLASRLTHLVAEGMMQRVPYQASPERFEYRLTKTGAALYPAMIALMRWGDRWLAEGREPPVRVWHRACGPEAEPRIVCRACHGEPDAREVSYALGPGACKGAGAVPPRMRRSSRPENFLRGRVDNVARVLSIIGDRWTFLLIREAFFGVRRFDAMQGHLRVATNVLSDRLQRLVEVGIFERQLYSPHPERFEYRLTAKGRDLYPSILMLMRFGEELRPGKGGPALLLTHNACGKRLVPALVCGSCGEEVGMRDMAYEVSPGAN